MTLAVVSELVKIGFALDPDPLIIGEVDSSADLNLISDPLSNANLSITGAAELLPATGGGLVASTGGGAVVPAPGSRAAGGVVIGAPPVADGAAGDPAVVLVSAEVV
jgi:hypothetical protein